MKFRDLLLAAIRRSEIPPRLERGAEEALLAPLVDALENWVAAHIPEDAETEFDAGYRALAVQLLEELEGGANIPE